jgi:predicted O-methyltransferase YrrM
VADNVVRKGALLDSNSNDANVQGMQRLLDIIAAERRVSATGIQTVGSKGYDGFVLARLWLERSTSVGVPPSHHHSA